MSLKKTILSLLLVALIMPTQAQTFEGSWRVALETPGGELPFFMEIYREGSMPVAALLNGEEALTTADLEMEGSTLYIRSSVFNSKLTLHIDSTGTALTGTWNDYSRGPDYTTPLSGKKDISYRFFASPETPAADISGNWKTIFDADGTTTEAIAILEQEGNHLSGTFLTATGDYRFLEGEMNGAAFRLSAFDGAHAFLFAGSVEQDGTLNGTFYSGNHWEESFYCTRDAAFELPSPDSLTTLSGDTLSFCFPDTEGNTVCLSDEQFRGKVVIVQIMASWCPNCMDETEYLAGIYDTYHAEGLEIIALAFERQTDPDAVAANFDRLRKKFGISYPILLAGDASKKTASGALPQLNRVIAYPTTVIIDRNGQVQYIHTGFNGPATGELFLAFRARMEGIIESLL